MVTESGYSFDMQGAAAIIGVILAGITARAAILRWQIKQRIDSWKAIVGTCLEQDERSFQSFTRFYHIMSSVMEVLRHKEMDNESKRAEIARLAECLPENLPNAAAELLDIRLMHLLEDGMLHEMKAEPASEMLSRSLQMRTAVLLLSEKTAESIGRFGPTEAYNKMVDACGLAARKFAQVQNVLSALDIRYREWLLSRGLFQSLTFNAFKQTDDWREIKRMADQVRDPKFYENK